MNNRELAVRKKLRDDFQHYAEKCLKIRVKEGAIRPFALNQAQHYLHDMLEAQRRETGRVRAVILKGRQQGCCFSPDTRVLTEDFRWVAICDVSPGDRLFAVDEEAPKGRGSPRYIKSCTVEAKATFVHDLLEVTLSNGTILKMTPEHRMLCKQRGGTYTKWREARHMKVGDNIRAVAQQPDDVVPDFDDGWFSGILDGEGSFGANPQLRISVSQVDGPVLSRMKAYLLRRGIRYYELVDTRKGGDKSKLGNKHVHILRVDRLTDIVRLLTLTRPSRFLAKPKTLHGRKPPTSCDGFDAWPEIVSIRNIGKGPVVDLQTSAKTYIAEGLISHNSTYVQGRYFWRITHQKGVRAFILTHEQDATNNLFEMAHRFHIHVPDIVRPRVGASNAKELVFADLDSSYKVGTAGTKGVGRSATIQFFHGSEVGFWPNAEEHAKGILQAIADVPGTEVILESTANGLGNYFHQQWQLAEYGESDFIPIFIPWYWQDEYRKPVDTAFRLTEAETELKKQFALDDEQLNWRRYKIIELSATAQTDGVAAFKQEYPNTPAEAFQTSGDKSLIQPEDVLPARTTYAERYGPVFLGVDAARFGPDRTAIIRRQGRVAYGLEVFKKKDIMETVGLTVKAIKADKPSRVYVDVAGIGAGVVDRLRELGYSDIVVPVNGGEKAYDVDRYFNRRAEMWGQMKEWLMDKPVQIPDSDALHGDLCTPGATIDSKSRLKLEPKEDIQKRGVRSPDLADALALTFAEPYSDAVSVNIHAYEPADDVIGF